MELLLDRTNYFTWFFDLKGARITQQWRAVNAKFSIKIKAHCLHGSFAFA